MPASGTTGQTEENQSVRLIRRDQTFLRALPEFFDQTFLAQRIALVAAQFGINQRHRRAGEEEPCAFATLMLGETTHRIVADPAVQRAIGGANEVDEPGLAHGFGDVDRFFAKAGHFGI